MLSAVVQDVLDYLFVGEPDDVIEILDCVLGIAAGMRATQHRHRAAATEQVAEGIGQLGRLGERANEQQIQIGRKLLEQILESGITDKSDIVPSLATPHPDGLGHYAGQVCVHHPAINGGVWALCNEIEDAYAETETRQSLSRVKMCSLWSLAAELPQPLGGGPYLRTLGVSAAHPVNSPVRHSGSRSEPVFGRYAI
jgi:hypothetical protein